MAPYTDEPTITNNIAGIYAADLLYEQNCKCGTISVLGSAEQWVSSGDDDIVWKIVILNNGGGLGGTSAVIDNIDAKNMSVHDLANLKATKFINGQEIMGLFTSVRLKTMTDASVILYKDCLQS